MSDNNYICCQWRDAITDLPDGTICCVLRGGLGQGSTPAAYLLGEGWIRCDRPQMMPVEEGDQWLDVTDTPAVAVARVQTAVSAIHARRNALTANEKTVNGWHMGIEEALDVLNTHTGVTPSEVQ